MMNHPLYVDCDDSGFVEVDPTRRYGRYNEVLGRGATKTVYRGFDSHEGIEIAWNKVEIGADILQNPERIEYVYVEVHLLKTLNHNNVMKFYNSWVDTKNKTINFVSEMFSSSLRQYRLRHKRVAMRALKHWFRQILGALVYLHNHDPPVIHRDLKCDNIFINGNQGEVKIGDLGLSAIVQKSRPNKFVGTPEFMAPEIYAGEYNELVDIYSFGMCILELVTFQYPYSECADAAEIYKDVISGKKPDALYKVKDPELRQFVEKCLAHVTLRPSAVELLNHHFLQIEDSGSDLSMLDYISSEANIHLIPTSHPRHDISNSGVNDQDSDRGQNEQEHHQIKIQSGLIEQSLILDSEHSAKADTIIRGKMRDDGSIFLRLRVADEKGRIRKIYFPFNTKIDTALDVATEMVAELKSTDKDVMKLADIIDAEISSLVPKWIPLSASYSQRHLQQLQNPHDRTYNDPEPKPSEWNDIVQQKPQDSLTNNPFGCRPSIQSVEEHISKQAPSYIGSKPTIYLGDPPKAPATPLKSVAVKELVSNQLSLDKSNDPNTHLGVPSETPNTNLQART